MNKNIAGIVVLYNPDEGQLLRNIGSYLPFIDKLFVIDNTERPALNNLQEKLQSLQGVNYTANKTNEGIAAALNKGAAMASENGYRWLLTMDQDSFFEDGQADLYFSVSDREFLNKNDIALL
ncbi:MAG: glycosyltransferase, partial [Bacteroidota bacterium]